MPLFAPIAVPNTTGAGWSFQHAEVQIAGMRLQGGFKSIKYSRKREREKAYSNHPDPVFKTLGQNAYEATAELYLEWWRQVIQQLKTQVGGDGYGDLFFDVFVSYAADGFAPITDVITGCTFDTTEADNSAGVAALTRTVDLAPMKIYFARQEDVTNELTFT